MRATGARYNKSKRAISGDYLNILDAAGSQTLPKIIELKVAEGHLH
jgi:hypothetical protein